MEREIEREKITPASTPNISWAPEGTPFRQALLIKPSKIG